MPPKKKVEEVAPVEPVEVKPERKDLGYPKFVGELLEMDSPEEVLKQIALITGRQDYAENPRNSAHVDYLFTGLLFAKENCFTPEKTAGFLAVLGDLMHELKENGPSIEILSEKLKSILFDGDVIAQEGAPPTPPPPVVEEKPAEVAPPPAEKDKKDKKGAKDSKAPPAKDSKQPAQPPAPDSAAVAATAPAGVAPTDENLTPDPVLGYPRPPLKGLFELEDVKGMTDYIVNTLFKHAKLYHYVYTQSQEVHTFEAEVLVQRAMDPPPLAEAMTPDEYQQYLDRIQAEKEAEEEAKRQAQAAVEAEAAAAAAAEAAKPRYVDIQFTTEELETVVNNVKVVLQSDVEKRQQTLIDRLSALEARLSGGVASPRASDPKKK